MQTWAVIQARMGSSRLPGKVMMDIGGKPMLHRVIERTLDAVPNVIVATTWNGEDAIIEQSCLGRYPVRVHRGDPANVLDRYIEAAAEVEADRVVRITGDCPLIDPVVIRKVVDALTPEVDYSSNIFPRTFPKGLDCEAFWYDVLLRLDRISKPEEREHVTPAVRRCPDLFSIVNVTGSAHINWSVDTQEDLDRVRRIHAAL